MNEQKWSLTDLVAELESARNERDKWAGVAEALEVLIPHLTSLPATPANGNGKSPTSANLVEVLYQKLKDHGQPIHRKQLHRYAIEDMGLFVRGDNPVNNLTAHMSNDARFESTKGDGMWGLTEWRQGDTPKGYANRLETQRTALQAPSTRPSGSV